MPAAALRWYVAVLLALVGLLMLVRFVVPLLVGR
jgi:hypothetical protein